MYQKCGTLNRTRFLDITKLGQSLGSGIFDSLVGMHAFTSCDSVSAFAGRGKIGTLKLLKSDKIYQEAFSELEFSWNASAELKNCKRSHAAFMYPLPAQQM